MPHQFVPFLLLWKLATTMYALELLELTSLLSLLWHQLRHYCDNYCLENYVVMHLHNLFDGGLSDYDNIGY